MSRDKFRIIRVCFWLFKTATSPTLKHAKYMTKNRLVRRLDSMGFGKQTGIDWIILRSILNVIGSCFGLGGWALVIPTSKREIRKFLVGSATLKILCLKDTADRVDLMVLGLFPLRKEYVI